MSARHRGQDENEPPPGRNRSRTPHGQSSRGRTRSRGRGRTRSPSRDRGHRRTRSPSRDRGRGRTRSQSPRNNCSHRRSPPRRPIMTRKQLHLYAKAYCRYANAIVPPSSVIDEHTRQLALTLDDDATPPEVSAEEQYILDQWPQLDQACRGRLSVELKDCSEARLNQLKAQLDKGWSLGRSDTVESLGEKVLKWIDYEKVGDESIIPKDTIAPSAVADKSCLGFSNLTTAQLLCPVTLDIGKPGIREGLESGLLSKEALPSLLFKDYKFDETAPEDLCGALHPSGLLLYAYQQAHTGPGSVGKQGIVGKGSNSARAGQKSVNGPSVAFAGITLRHSISASKRCDLVSTEFDYEAFYKQIIAFFDENRDTQAGKKLLEQWNARIYGTGHIEKNDQSITALIAKAAADKAAAEKLAAEKAAAEKAAAEQAAVEQEEREEQERQVLRDATNASA